MIGDGWLSVVNTFPLGMLQAIQHRAQVPLQSLIDEVLVYCGLVRDVLPLHYSYVSHCLPNSSLCSFVVQKCQILLI